MTDNAFSSNPTLTASQSMALAEGLLRFNNVASRQVMELAEAKIQDASAGEATEQLSQQIYLGLLACDIRMKATEIISASHEISKDDLGDIIEQACRQSMRRIRENKDPRVAALQEYLATHLPPANDIDMSHPLLAPLIQENTKHLARLFQEALESSPALEIENAGERESIATALKILFTKLGKGAVSAGSSHERNIELEATIMLQQAVNDGSSTPSNALKEALAAHVMDTLLQMPNLVPKEFMEPHREMVAERRETLEEYLKLEVFGHNEPEKLQHFLARIEDMVRNRANEILPKTPQK